MFRATLKSRIHGIHGRANRKSQGIPDRIYKLWLGLESALVLGLDLGLGYRYRCTGRMTVPQPMGRTATGCP